MTTSLVLRLILVAVFLSVSALALAAEPSVSQTEPQVATAKPAAVGAQRSLPPATWLAFALMASSGTPLPQTGPNSNGR
jgi:hypothetical protein